MYSRTENKANLPDVDEHVGDESPRFLPIVRLVDEQRGHWARSVLRRVEFDRLINAEEYDLD